MNYMNELNKIVTACSEQAAKLAQDSAILGNLEPLYLYYKPSTETENGQLLMVQDSEKQPEGFILATGEGLRCNVPFAAYWQWIKEQSTRLPVLAWGK